MLAWYLSPDHLLYCQIQDDFLLGMNVHEWVWNNEYTIIYIYVYVTMYVYM